MSFSKRNSVKHDLQILDTNFLLFVLHKKCKFGKYQIRMTPEVNQVKQQVSENSLQQLKAR